MWLLLSYNGRAEYLKQRPYNPQRQKYLLFVPWQKKLAKLHFTAFLEWEIKQEIKSHFFFLSQIFFKNYSYLTREQKFSCKILSWVTVMPEFLVG